MSSLKIETLSNLAGTKTIPVDRVASGVAAAWVNFNGTGTVAIRASYNVSSITDNGVGDYTVNFATALADANYAINGAMQSNGLTSTGAVAVHPSATPTTTGCRIYTSNCAAASQAAADPVFVNVAVFR